MRKTYSPEVKAKVVRAVMREDKTPSQIAAEYDIHPNLVQRQDENGGSTHDHTAKFSHHHGISLRS